MATTAPARRAPYRPLLAVAVLVGTVLAALLTAAGPASAHAALTGSSPADGAVVATAPEEVSLSFSEPVAMGDDSIRVLEPGGERADAAKVRDTSAAGKVSYAVDLRTDLPNGTYTVAWQAVSADSHPISGAYTFSIGAPSATSVSLPDGEPGDGLVGTLYDVARYVAYAGFVLLVGAAAFVLRCWPRGASVRPVQRLVAYGWVALTVATLAMLMLRSPYTGSGRLADAFDLDGLQDVLETKTGTALVSRLLLLGVAALFVAVLFGAYAQRRHADPADDGDEGDGDEGDGDEGDGDEGDERRNDLTFGLAVGGTVVAAGIAATWALSEHASTGIQTGLAMPVDVLHLLAVAGWLGGLAALLTALHRAPSLDASAVRKFSRVAFGCVVVLALTGLYQSWRQVGSWSALTGTDYGRLLIAKVVLVAALVAIARASRRWTAQLAEAPEEHEEAAEAEGTEAVGDPVRAAQLARQRAAMATVRRKKARDADPVKTRLRRSVLVEAGVATVVLAVTTVLTATEPGRTQEEAGRSPAASSAGPLAPGSAPSGSSGPAEVKVPFDTGAANGKGTVRLTLGPARPGGNELHLWVSGADGKPLDAPEVRMSLTLQDKQIGPLPVTLAKVAAGHWSAGSVQIPMPGEWQVKVTVRTSDIDQTTVEEHVRIG
ncbi:copper resistance CopC/CopD family protein [Streptomyces sp. NPDC020412]|uniref:copper resistance CopC/CopD family protein n=1 Tax=Streptomyces sp. NPDC020412 TaxID=3365073 RepID=UPI0037AECBFD